jgi:hypothetical protein
VREPRETLCSVHAGVPGAAHMPPGVLASLRSLRSLWLCNARLTAFPEEALGLSGLLSLCLNDNKIPEVRLQLAHLKAPDT